VTHTGATAGYRTYLARWPDRSLSIAVLCNAATANPSRMARAVATHLLGPDPEAAPPSPPVALAAEQLAPLAGRYRDSTSDAMVTFAVREGALTLAGGGSAVSLVHLGDLRFWRAGAEYRFERSGDGFRVVQFDQAWRRYERMAPSDTAGVRVADFVGRYRSPELDVVVEIAAEAGRLVFKYRPPGRFTLRPLYRDGFAGPGPTVRFDRARDGRVAGFRVFAGRVRGLEFERLP
jgi:hypothetical protein